MAHQAHYARDKAQRAIRRGELKRSSSQAAAWMLMSHKWPENENVPKIRELAARGMGYTRIGREIGLSRARVHQLVVKYKIEMPGVTPHRKTINNMELARAKEGLLPLSYMLKVMRDKNAHINRRDDMAKAAAPYLHPRLASVEMKAEHTIKKVAREPMSREEWAEKYSLAPIEPSIVINGNGNGSTH